MVLDDLTNLEEIKIKIKELEREIEILREEYYYLVPPCNNKECAFYNKLHKNHCSWTHYIDECSDYIPESIKED